MFLGLKVRLYPNTNQKKLIDTYIEGAKFVYNYFLAYAKNNEIYDEEIWRKELYQMMKKGGYEKIDQCDYYLLLYQLKSLKKAFDNFFKGIANEPRAKSKISVISAFKLTNSKGSIVVDNNHIVTQQFGRMKCKMSKDLSDKKICSIIIKRITNETYEASVLYETFVSFLKKTYRKVGIDIGVRKFITTSDNTFYFPVDSLYKYEIEIKRLNKLLSKKEYGSNNWNKLKLLIQKKHLHRKNYIKDTLNKATTDLVKKYDVIFMENLSIKDLLKEQQNKNIRRKITEASLYMIREMLEYKCNMYGRKLIFVDRYFPSTKICSECGFRHDPLDSEIFLCPVCGAKKDRDYNAALNIYKAGLRKITK